MYQFPSYPDIRPLIEFARDEDLRGDDVTYRSHLDPRLHEDDVKYLHITFALAGRCHRPCCPVESN